MKRSAIILILVAVASAFGLFFPNAHCFSEASLKSGDANIPVPPEQSQPWTPPPTKLSPVVVSAITELFNEGLADPRGCEYREIEVKTGIDLNFKTHGWVLPGTGESRFAVQWNGLVYPVVTIGSPADLQKDVADLVTKDQKQWSSYTGTNRDVRGNWTAPEWVSVSHINLLPLKAAMLLRLGRPDLAESVWNQWFSLSKEGKDDPYLLLAREWTEALYDRAIFAHKRGDDALCLALCRTLLPLRSTVEAVAARRGLPPDTAGKPYLEDLEHLPELAADQERRAQEPPYTPALDPASLQGAERIAALIRDLEQVHVEQMMNPGQTDTYDDPIVQALIKEGEPAIEPLLKCWEEDSRLTRTQFTEGMSMGFAGPVVHVYEAAYIALDGILGTPFYFSDSDSRHPGDPYSYSDPRDKHPRDLSLDDRKFLGAKIRAYWEKYKGMSPPERCFAILQDDNAGPDAWFKSVDRMVQSPQSGDISFGIYGGGMGFGGPSQPGKPMKGEPLRGKSNPSVSDLIIKRFEQLVQANADKDFDPTNLSKLLLALAAWDGKNHLEDLRKLGQELDARFVRETGKPSEEVNVTLCEKRLQLGDASALQDYVNYLQALTPKELETSYQSGGGFFPIMWHYPNDPAIEKVAGKIFTGKDAPLVPLPNPLVPTPLIGLAAFRQELERGLNDTTPAGTLTVREGAFDYDFKATRISSSASPGFAKGAPFVPKPGSIITFRLCDCYADQLSQVTGFPECKLYWPEAKRDKAVAICRTFLQQYGNDYQSRPEDPYDDDMYAPLPSHARFFIPQLDHPATPEDVKAGRALFSLSGTTRVWKMPTYPLGPAWQAEEVLVNGKWERYFGVLGDGNSVKVPASEMEFPGSFPWSGKVTKEISGEIGGPSNRASSGFDFSIARHLLPLGSPVPVTVDIYNHSGLDLNAPDSVMLPPGATRMLPEGISFSVSYSEKIPPVIQRYTEPLFDYGTFQDVPLRKDVTVTKGKTIGPTLYPTQKLTVLNIDLRDFFDMNRPGTYRVKALFHVPGQPEGKSSEITFSVADTVH